MKVGDRILALLLIDARIVDKSDSHGKAYELELASEDHSRRRIWVSEDEITGCKVVRS